MGIGTIQPLHLLIIVLVVLVTFAAFIGTAMFLIRYSHQQGRKRDS